jgi:hypothetical protein
VDDQHAAAVPRHGQQRRPVERNERAQVEHAGLDAIRRQPVGHAHRDMDIRPIRDDREVVTRAPQRRGAER